MHRFFGILAFALLVSLQAFAEQSVESYIKNLGAVNISGKGGVFLPPAVYKSMANDQVSEVQQFVLTNHIMNSAVRAALKEVPDQRMPYLQAKAMLDNALCKIAQAYQQAMLISLLPMLGAGSGASSGVMAQALTSSQGNECSGGGQGFDPALLSMFGKK